MVCVCVRCAACEAEMLAVGQPGGFLVCDWGGITAQVGRGTLDAVPVGQTVEVNRDFQWTCEYTLQGCC